MMYRLLTTRGNAGSSAAGLWHNDLYTVRLEKRCAPCLMELTLSQCGHGPKRSRCVSTRRYRGNQMSAARCAFRYDLLIDLPTDCAIRRQFVDRDAPQVEDQRVRSPANTPVTRLIPFQPVENQVLNYSLVQYRLLPILAQAFAFHYSVFIIPGTTSIC